MNIMKRHISRYLKGAEGRIYELSYTPPNKKVNGILYYKTSKDSEWIPWKGSANDFLNFVGYDGSGFLSLDYKWT